MGRKAATDFLESLDATPPTPEPEPPAPVAPAVAPAGTGRARAEAYLASIPDADLRAPSQRTEALDPAKTDALRLELLNAVRDEKRSELRRKPGMAEADIDREVERAVREVDAVTRVTGPGAEDGSDIIATLEANLEPASLSSTMTRVFGQRLIPVGPEAPTKADRDKAQRALEQSFRGGASTVRDDLSRAWEKGLTPTEEIKDPETAQRVSWMDKLEESAAFGAKAALTGGLWPLYESVTGSGPGFDVHPIDAVREAAKDPVVQRMSPVSTEGPTRAAKAAVGLYARSPAPDVMQAVIDGATKLGLDVEVEPGKFAEVADSLRPYEAFDAANDSYLTGDRSKVEALPWYELPAILRGEVPDVAVFKTRAQEGDPDLAALVPFLDRDDSFIAKQVERLPVGVIRKVQPDMAPTDAELDNVFKVRDGVKEWRAEDMARDAAALFNAGLMDGVGQDGRLYVAPSKLQKAMQVANLAWTGLMNVDVNPLSPLAPIGVPGIGEAAERFLPEGTFQNTLTDIRVPTKAGLDSMIRSGTYDGILAWAGLGGSDDYADLYAPGSTWLSRSLAETADPNYAGRWIADTYERAGGVPNSPTMRAMVAADLAAQVFLPAEELALVPLARGLAAANRGRRALAVARELGQDTRAARRTALASMLNLNTGLTPAEGARLNELVPLVRAKTATPEQAAEAAALTRKGAPKDAVEALHGQLRTQALEGIRNGTLRPEQIGPRTREQLVAMFRRAGVQDADGMVTRLMNDLADRRAAVLDTMTELAEVGGPATQRVRASPAYFETGRELETLVRAKNLTPQERDVMLRILEASAFRAVQDGAVATPEEYFARQMWRRATPDEEAAEAARTAAEEAGGEASETLGAGTLYQRTHTRVPTAKGIEVNPEEADLLVGLEAAKADPASFARNAELVYSYPMTPKAAEAATPEAKAEAFIQAATDNLLWLHDKVPPETAARARRWYDGASELAGTWAERYGIPKRGTAAVLAVLSPQTDWFMNVTRAERVLDALATKQAFQWDTAMERTAERILSGEQYSDTLNAIKGKKLGELQTPYQKAMWIRIYDETYNPRTFRELSPDNGYIDYVRRGDGKTAEANWLFLRDVAKAVQVAEDPSQATVHRVLGGEHKVRNFYNNIFDPTSTHGDVTIDTHAVAAAHLSPFGGTAPEVVANFGGKGSGASSRTGQSGTYPLLAEAYRRAAAARGILPREMQSITWEAARGLFPASLKKGLDKDIKALWQRFAVGEATLDDTREAILARAGGINPPVWTRSGAGRTSLAETSSYLDQLPVVQRAGAGLDAGTDVGRGVGGAPSGGVGAPDGGGSGTPPVVLRSREGGTTRGSIEAVPRADVNPQGVVPVTIEGTDRAYRLNNGVPEWESPRGWRPVTNLETASLVREAAGVTPSRPMSVTPSTEPVDVTSDPTSYKMTHRPSADGPTAADLLAEGEWSVPPDILTHPERYTGFRGNLREFWQNIVRAQGNPDAPIKVYRALPPDRATINPGDWVTPSREYARLHLDSNGEPGWHVVEATVPAGSLKFAGDDLMEWGFFGDTVEAGTLYSKGESGVTRGAITPEATTRTVPNPDYPAWVADGTQAQADVARLEGMGTPGAETPEWRAWKAAQDERANLQTQRDTLRRNPRAEDPEWQADLDDIDERLAALPDPGPEPARFDYDLRYIPDEMRRLTPEWVSWREGDSERVALLERWTAELEALQGEPRELDPAWREEVRSLQEHIGAFSEGEPEPTKFVDVPDGWTAKYDADVDAYIVRDESGKTIGSATSYDDGVITPEQALTLVASRRAAEAPRGIDLRVVGEVAATDPTGVSLRNPRNIYAAQLAHARARLAGLRARKVPRNMDAPGLTRWLIRLFKTGDVRTAMHEGTHLLDLVLGEEWTRKAAKALGYTDEQVTAAFGGDNRLLVEIRERIAEAGTRELRGTLRPGSKVANAMEDVSDFIGDVWRRVRNVPGVTTPEFKRVWDATFRPQDTLRDLAVRLVDEREPGPITRTVFTTGAPEEEIRVGPQRRRGQAEQATNVLRADNEVRAMLGIREGQTEVRADELLANALATIGTEQARRSWGFGELEMLTPLTAVSPQRKKDIQREVAAYRAAWLGGEAPRPSVVGGEEVFTLTPDQARGMRAMVNDLLDSPVSTTLPERLKDPAADVSTLTAEEWNAIVNRQLEMKAGAGAWRDRAAERAAVSGATRLVNLVGDYTRDPRRPRAVADTATALRDAFVVQAKVADYVNPAAREVLEGMAREIGDAGKAVAERVITIQRQGKGWREALPLVAASVQPESVPVEQLSTLRAVDRIPEATDIEQVMASGDDLRTLFNSSPIADPRQTAYEQAGLALLGNIHARMRDGFDYTAALSDMGVTTDAANDAMAYVQEGVRRRRELVDQVGKDILLTFAGADDAQALAGQGPLLTERARRAYASWYTGDWVDGLLLNTETGKAASSPLFDQGGAALRVLVRLEARRRLAGMTRRLAEVGATGNLSEVLAAGTRYDRPYEFGTLANEVGAITGPKHLADVAHYIDAETSWSLYDTVRMDAPEDVPSLALAPGRLPPSGAPNPMAHDEALRILQRLGFKRGKGTGWKPIDLPDGSRIIAPPLFMEPIEEVVKNTAPTAGAFGSGEKLGTMVAGTGNARSFADNAAQLAVDALHNGYTYAVGKFKAGLTTGLGPLMRPAFFMGNFLGGMAQAYTRVGAIGAAKALTKPLLLNEEGAVVRRVMKRMWADGQGFPGWAPERPMDHGFFDTFGRWHSDRSIADGLVRAGLNSSLPQAELSRSLIEDIKANEPGIWNRLMNNPKLAAGVGAAVGGVLGGPGGAVAGVPVGAMLTRWWQDTMTYATTGVDNYWRVSLYVDALKRGVPEEEAARVARDATFDYNQMTDFERRVMRRAVLFYSFQRRNQDLFWWAVLNEPGRLMAQLRLLGGLQRANLEEDPELFLPEWAEGRPVVGWREPLAEGHAANNSTGAVMLLPRLPLGDALGLWQGLWGALNMEPSGLSATVGKANPLIQAGFILTTGTDIHRMRSIESYNVIPNWFVEMDDALTGGMLVRDTFRATPGQAKNPASEGYGNAPVWVVGGSATDKTPFKWWWVFRQLTAAGSAMDTITQMQRADLGETLVGEHGYVQAAVDAATRGTEGLPEDTETARVGLTEGEELGKWLGVMPLLVPSRPEVAGRAEMDVRSDINERIRGLRKTEDRAYR